METFYHGSSQLFERFDMSHVLEGAGKVKFGYGVYVTSAYKTAAHYSAKGGSEHNYVYTIEVPELEEGNYIAFHQKVHPDIVSAVSKKLGVEIPDKYLADAGKDFRVFLANHFNKKDKLAGEKAAADLLHSVGVKSIIWPNSWQKGYDGETNRAILCDSDVRIVAIDEVELEGKDQLKSIVKNIYKREIAAQKSVK